MNSEMKKTRIAEKPYRDKHNKQDYKNYNNQLQKKTTKLQKKKQYDLYKKELLLENKMIRKGKQNCLKENKEKENIMDEHIDFG